MFDWIIDTPLKCSWSWRAEEKSHHGVLLWQYRMKWVEILILHVKDCNLTQKGLHHVPCTRCFWKFSSQLLYRHLWESVRSSIMKFLFYIIIKPLSANFTKWSYTLKQFARNLPTNCLSVFDHFMGLAHKGLKQI